MNRKIERLLVAVLATAFCVYILLRAWLLPITVDESATALNHVPRDIFDTLFYDREANPNNHILNTLGIKLFSGLFGWHPFVVRVPALLGGILYLGAAVMLSGRLSSRPEIRLFALLALLGNPYVLEFFSLARGYGLAAGLMLAAVWQAWRFFESNAGMHLTGAIALAGLAVYANFTLLLFFAPFTVLLFYAAWQLNPSGKACWTAVRGALLVCGLFAALWYLPLQRLSDDSAFRQWERDKTFYYTAGEIVKSAVLRNPYYSEDLFRVLAWLLLLFGAGMGATALLRWWQAGRQLVSDPRIFPALLFPAAAVTNIVQAELLGVAYPEGRLAQFYYPLFALQLGVAAVWLWQRRARLVWLYVAPVTLFIAFNLRFRVNLYETSDWWYDQNTYRVLNYIRETYETEGRTEPLVLDAFFLLQNSFMYHLERYPDGWDKYVRLTPWHPARPPQREAEFYYAESVEDARQILDEYDIVLSDPKCSTLLLRKKRQAHN